MIDKFFIALYSNYYVYYAIFMPIFVMISICMLVGATRTIKISQKRYKSLTILIVILSLFMILQFIPYLYQRAAITSKQEAKVVYNYKRAIQTSFFKAQKALIWLDLGVYYSDIAKNELALEAFEKVHEYFKRYDIEKYGILVGKINLKLNEYDKAIEIFKELNATKWVVVSYILKEDFNSALEQMDKVIEKENSDPENYITRAIIYLNLGDLKSAKFDYLKALELTSDQEKRLVYLDQLKKYKTYHKSLYLDDFQQKDS